MANWLLLSLSGLLILVGFIGCVIPVVPGPVIGYAALWVPVLFGGPYSSDVLIIGGVITLVVEVIDYVLPTFFAQKFNCSKLGVAGCFIGTIVGLFFMPWGLLLGPIIGTMTGELLHGKSVGSAIKGGIGAFLGFTTCVILKLLTVALFAYWIFKPLFE